MKSHIPFALCAAATALSFGISGLLQAQVPAAAQGTAQGKESLVVDGKGMPPRAAPTDYAAHAQLGKVTIAADFTRHTVGTQEGLLTTPEFVVIEAGMFGPPEARLMLSVDNFSIRINGKKPLPSQPYELVAKTLKDPDYEEPASNKSGKTVVNTGGKGDGADPNAPPPALIPIPFEVRRGWELRAKRDSMPIGDRALPQAGLLFFPYAGDAKGIHSVELIYDGPAGKVTLPLHP